MKHFKFINYPQDCLKSLKTVYFGSGSWALDSTARAVLRQNAACLRDNPDIDIILEGHCDKEESKGPEPHIGKKRAEAVKDYLVKLGVKKNRFEIEDRGATMPIDPGDGKTALARNRRVEFILKYKIDDCNGEDACGRKENGDGCEKCDRESQPDCNGKDKPDDCFYEEECGKKEGECTPDEVCDDCDDDCEDCYDDDGDCDYCDKDDGSPNCEEKDGCGLDEVCQDCDNDEDCPNDSGPCGEGGPPPPPPGCGIMEIIPFPECRGDESRTPHNGGKGQSA
jgi:hypothetical protein